MSRTNYKNTILEFYNTFIEIANPEESTSVAWSTKDSQFTRFKILNEIGITKDDTILDLGCGMGHYTDFLESINYSLNNYTGIDINEKYVNSCKKRKPNVTFIQGEIFDLNTSFDYVIGSGIFTVGMTKHEIIEAILCAYDICRKGIAFNFLTKEFLNDNKYNTFVPEEFYNELNRHFPNIKLVTDYLGTEDFTIYIYKV